MALAEELSRRAPPAAELPTDLGSIERGLRRLAKRGSGDGGQYGRWLARYLGAPPDVARWLRWLGQYHSRFADLPVPLRGAQLALWDEPPTHALPEGVWVDLGVASVAMRRSDFALVAARLERAEPRLARAPLAAQLEHALFVARRASDSGDGERLEEALARVGAGLSELPDADDAACYRARWLDARAYRCAHPSEGEADHEAALALYEQIEGASRVPFVAFRRAVGRAYCLKKLGDGERAAELALEAAEHAGDGGFVRFRVMALNLASRCVEGERAARWRDRAHAMAAQLEDEDLLARVER